VDRLVSLSATQGRQQTAPNLGMGERHGVSSTFGTDPLDDLVGPAEVQLGQQRGQAACVEAMNSRRGRGQLDVMPPI